MPFDRDMWAELGELVISCSNGDLEVSLQVGYFKDDALAVCIEGRTGKSAADVWSCCANVLKAGTVEVFYTENDIFFPVESALHFEIVRKIAFEFISDPFALPSIVEWTDCDTLAWPV